MNGVVSFPKLNLNFTVNRIAFKIFGLEIYWYGIIIFIAVAAASAYALLECKRIGINTQYIFDLLVLGTPISILCARIYYVVFNFRQFKNANFFDILNIRNGGIAIYGAIIGGLVAGLLYSKVHKIKIAPLLDIFSVCLLIGQTIGRFGNFVNCEAYGTTTKLPWAMDISGFVNAKSVHPTFIYESLWNLIGIFILNHKKKSLKFQGQNFCNYLIWYGIGRTWIEGLRADSLMLGHFRISQILSIFILIFGMVIILSHNEK